MFHELYLGMFHFLTKYASFTVLSNTFIKIQQVYMLCRSEQRAGEAKKKIVEVRRFYHREFQSYQ